VHVSVEDNLYQLVNERCLDRQPLGPLYLYTAADRVRHQQQWAARQAHVQARDPDEAQLRARIALLTEAAPRRGEGTPWSGVIARPVAAEQWFDIVDSGSPGASFGRPAALRRTGRQTKTSTTVRMHKETRPFTPA